MSDLEQLKAAIDSKMATNPEIRYILKLISSGKASLDDSAKYSQILSHILGQELASEVLKLSDREDTTSELLHGAYDDVNDVYSQVQTALDKKAGIAINPKRAPFPAERVQQFAHSLVDPTVEDSVIKRRARAGSETITKSFHDDCIETNAKFRDNAGLKSYIIRKGSDCCEWCTKVAGKYRIGDQPEDIFRRHDNCDCTIIYDGQVLRGQTGAEGKRGKKWVEVPEGAGADEAVRFTPEQAAELESKHSLTNPNRSATIMERSIKGRNFDGLKSFGVPANTGSDLFSAEAKQNLLNREKEISNNRFETAFVFSSDGTEHLRKIGDISSVTFTLDELAIVKNGILTHNHPDKSSFSPQDIAFLLHNDVTELRACISDGTYILQQTKKTINRKPSSDAVEKEFFDTFNDFGKKYQEIAARNGKSILYYLRKIEEETIMSLAKSYGLNFRLEVVTNE